MLKRKSLTPLLRGLQQEGEIRVVGTLGEFISDHAAMKIASRLAQPSNDPFHGREHFIHDALAETDFDMKVADLIAGESEDACEIGRQVLSAVRSYSRMVAVNDSAWGDLSANDDRALPSLKATIGQSINPNQ